MWVPDKWQPLPTKEWLLAAADHAHNIMGNRGFGTFAVGAVGKTPLKVQLVIGVDSSVEHDVKVTPDKNVPPAVRFALEFASVVMAKEPYHAEVSCHLWAHEHSMTLFAVASSRNVCQPCRDYLARHSPGTETVDNWRRISDRNLPKVQRKYLTHNERRSVTLGSDWLNHMGHFEARYTWVDKIETG